MVPSSVKIIIVVRKVSAICAIIRDLLVESNQYVG